MTQTILRCGYPYAPLNEVLRELGITSLLVVHDAALPQLPISRWVDAVEAGDLPVTYFSDFKPNPDYKSVLLGINSLHMGRCDGILAIGGGSAMDVAKCIKLWAGEDLTSDLLHNAPKPNRIPLIAIPTTAGTGSEATRFAVIYKDGVKQSVTSADIIPQVVLFDPAMLHSLPPYQRCATMLDALCHAIESCWSVNSTQQSRAFSQQAIRGIMGALTAYLANTESGNAAMQEAAFTAGRAINITQTTAGHAMCYKLTSLYRLAHGHAAALVVKTLWPYMLDHADKCADPRGSAWLQDGFRLIAQAMGATDERHAAAMFAHIVDAMELPSPALGSEEELDRLVASVNPDRLKNNPVPLTQDVIRKHYCEILRTANEKE